MGKLEEMDKFLEKYNLPKLNHEEIENLNRPIKSMEIETVIINLPGNKSPGPDGFTPEFYQKYREEQNTYPTQTIPGNCRGGKLPNSFYEATIILIPKPDKDATKNHGGVITQLQPDILECEVKWALESITMNKASGGDGIPVELFQILKDDAVKLLHSICQKIWKTQQWPQD